MEKSNRSVRNICIAAIKRSTMKPYDFKWTKFYDENAQFNNTYPGIALELMPDELIICSTVIDADNFSILTTQKLLTKEAGNISSGNLNGATDKLYGDFKGAITKSTLSFGLVQLENGNELKYFIETGKASMVMIYGVRTRIQINAMTNIQMDKVARIWKRKTEARNENESHHYFKLFSEQPESEEFKAGWGSCYYYFETDEHRNAIRQVQVYENGSILKYDLQYLDDKFGGLTDQPLDESFNELQIDKFDFYKYWHTASNPPRFPEIVMSDGICFGQPHLEGNRLAVGDIVSHVFLNESAIDAAEDYQITLQQTKQALLYCRTLQCLKDKPELFCHNCTLRLTQDGDWDDEHFANWIRADLLLQMYFPAHYNNL